MRKRSRKKNDDGLDFWQPTSDLMSGLMYILMLIIVLLGLYLVQIPEYNQRGPSWGGRYDGYPSPSPTPGDEESEGEDGESGRSGELYPTMGHGAFGGGGETTPTPSPSPTPTASPTPEPMHGSEEGTGSLGDYMKSAVYVVMMDGDTERTIQQAGVEFELYDSEGVLQILNVYYPDQATYRSYLTMENGTYFFPEKLPEGRYQLHEMTEPEGYEAADNVEFELDEAHDWDDPYIVKVPLYPARNVIRVRMTDAATGAYLSGGGFEIVAAENIVTPDGTVRYRSGETVGEIQCGENGYGESEELYLGNYILRQTDVPNYYASYPEEVSVEVAKKASEPPDIHAFPSDKTRINITVVDELYESRVVSGAEFRVVPSRGLPYTATSDHLGRVRLEDIDKDTIFRITQTGASGDYRLNPAELSVTVTADGRINGESVAELTLTNRMIRVSIGITDEFSSIQIPGVRMSLYDARDELVHSWTSSGMPQTYTDLSPGNYYVKLNDDDEHRYEITVYDQADIQQYNITSTYVLHYLLYGGAALAVVLAAVFLVVRRRRKKKRAELSGEE